MPISAVVARTPYYVLHLGNRPTGPTVVNLRSEGQCSPIFGFSDRDAYGLFCGNSQLALTPYPLVKVYLRNRIGEASDGPRLVVIDAAGPREPHLHAATMENVLEAQQQRKAHVEVTCELTFDQAADAYRTEEESL